MILGRALNLKRLASYSLASFGDRTILTNLDRHKSLSLFMWWHGEAGAYLCTVSNSSMSGTEVPYSTFVTPLSQHGACAGTYADLTAG